MRRAGRGLAVDDAYLGIIGLEVRERLGVVLLGGAAQGLEIEGGLLLGHGVILLPFWSFLLWL